MTHANMNLKNIDPTNRSQVEQYADDVIAAILDASNGDKTIMIDLFRDHIISIFENFKDQIITEELAEFLKNYL